MILILYPSPHPRKKWGWSPPLFFPRISAIPVTRPDWGWGGHVPHVATLLLGQYTAFYESQDGCYRRDRQTDGRTPDRYVDPAPHTMRAASINWGTLNAFYRTAAAAFVQQASHAAGHSRGARLFANDAQLELFAGRQVPAVPVDAADEVFLAAVTTGCRRRASVDTAATRRPHCVVPAAHTEARTAGPAHRAHQTDHWRRTETWSRIQLSRHRVSRVSKV